MSPSYQTSLVSPSIMAELQEVLAYLTQQPMWWGLLILACSAMLEYVFPPFPGDTLILAGAVLVPRAGWSIGAVCGAITVGTLIGTSIDWRAGVWLADHREGDTWLHQWIQRDAVSERLDTLIAQFQKHGAIYVALNRFVPAFRALFFIAAGLARLSLPKVLIFASLSAALWNGAILAAGYMVGYNLEALTALVDQYSTVVWIGLGLVVAVFVVRKIVAWKHSS